MKLSIRYHQNFIRDPRLVSQIVGRLGIAKNDLVYEIGPGRGIITRQLVNAGVKVTAVEIDPRLVNNLRQDYNCQPMVKIIRADWLSFRPREKGYKVIGNIPFNLTAKIVNRLVNDPNFSTAWLVVQQEAAEKFCGAPKSTQWSVLHLPWFEINIVWRFKPHDFIPRPKVNPVFLNICRRSAPLIAARDKGDYYRLVLQRFNHWKHRGTKPGDLNFDRWLKLFKDSQVLK